jgi:hypothetical protein
MKICNKCNEEKELSEFNKDKYKKDGYMNFCKECRHEKHILNKEINNKRSREYGSKNKENRKKYNEKNRKKLNEYSKNWKINNLEYKERQSKLKWNRDKSKRENDPLFKLTYNIRTLISKTIREFGSAKKSKTYLILGCSFEEFKIYLENQFSEGMNWENYGKWHLDHKKPISFANTEDEIYELNNYKNFQPLWAFDNLSKGNRYTTL